MFWIVTFAISFVVVVTTGCSIEARVWDMNNVLTPVPAEIRHDKDYQSTEVAVSGHYQVQGQIAETTERRISGNYVVEGVIAYE